MKLNFGRVIKEYFGFGNTIKDNEYPLKEIPIFHFFLLEGAKAPLCDLAQADLLQVFAQIIIFILLWKICANPRTFSSTITGS